jgi:D-methionine transport system substrate-binding protein
MKKFSKLALIGLLVCLVATLAVGCGQKPGNTDTPQKITIGVTPVPHGEVINAAKPLLEKEGIELEVKEFTDYPIVNPALADKQLDANYFQHIPYLDDFNANSDKELVILTKVHIEPMAIYSKKIEDLKDLPANAKVAVPNDATNEGRALLLLQSAGLITLKEDAGLGATVADIVENPKNLKITELDAAQLPNALGDVDIAAINGNFALDAGLNPTKDSIYLEDSNSPYVNIVAVRAGEENNELLKKLAAALNSPEIKKFIEDTYEGAVIPVF